MKPWEIIYYALEIRMADAKIKRGDRHLIHTALWRIGFYGRRMY